MRACSKLMNRVLVFVLALRNPVLFLRRRAFEVYLVRAAVFELREGRNLVLLVLQKQVLLHHFLLAIGLLNLMNPLS